MLHASYVVWRASACGLIQAQTPKLALNPMFSRSGLGSIPLWKLGILVGKDV